MRFPNTAIRILGICLAIGYAGKVSAQRIQFPSNGLRPVQGNLGNTAVRPMTPLPQTGGLPSTPPSLGGFDPYRAAPTTTSPLMSGPFVGVPNTTALGGSVAPGAIPSRFPGTTQPVLPSAPASGTFFPGNAPGIFPPGGTYAPPPAYNPYQLPGQAGTYGNPQYGQPGAYSGSPSALFPGSANYPSQGPFGGFFRNLYNGVFGQPGNPSQGNVFAPNSGQSYGWNPQGSLFSNGSSGRPGFIRLFQGPRFQHAYILGNDDADALAVNDSDLSLAFALPNFLRSNQPLYLLPSFSLHQWAGPYAPSTADLPAVAYSAFLDSGWRSDPNRILGAELGLRVGMFSDFNTANTDSIRIMGRGIGSVRLTPRATLKLGVVYLDRNRIKLLPAGGLLWQPQPNTRFDIFFPEPKLASYLSTYGNVDTWWYVAGAYGGGSWTIQRADSSKDSIDLNDIRISLGLEFGKNDALREGRRNAFVEVGYIFERELLFRDSPMDNLDLQDSIVFRAGFGY